MQCYLFPADKRQQRFNFPHHLTISFVPFRNSRRTCSTIREPSTVITQGLWSRGLTFTPRPTIPEPSFPVDIKHGSTELVMTRDRLLHSEVWEHLFGPQLSLDKAKALSSFRLLFWWLPQLSLDKAALPPPLFMTTCVQAPGADQHRKLPTLPPQSQTKPIGRQTHQKRANHPSAKVVPDQETPDEENDLHPSHLVEGTEGTQSSHETCRHELARLGRPRTHPGHELARGIADVSSCLRN